MDLLLSKFEERAGPSVPSLFEMENARTASGAFLDCGQPALISVYLSMRFRHFPGQLRAERHDLRFDRR